MYKVVVVTPAGRERYLRVLLKYLLPQKADFVEWHLWLNTADENDIQYCKRLAQQHSWIKTIDPPLVQKNYTSLDIHRFFSYCTEADTVYIRLDDDVVYLEPEFVKKLARARIDNPEPFLVYGNIINNAAISFLHQENPALAFRPKHKCKYDCMDPVGWQNAEFAEGLHRAFLASILNGTVASWHSSFDKHICSNYERVSINCISWLGAEFAKFGGKVGADEEKWLSVDYPRELQKPNLLFGGAICAHFSFFTQREHLDRTDILHLYHMLAPRT